MPVEKIGVEVFYPNRIGILLRKTIQQNISSWHRDHLRKAGKVNRSIVLRARRTSALVEDWSIEQKKRWADRQAEMEALKVKPFSVLKGMKIKVKPTKPVMPGSYTITSTCTAGHYVVSYPTMYYRWW